MKVAVIGAGVSGLFALKSCLEEGLEVQCFEKTDQIGGLWVYREEFKEGDPASVYDGLCSNTSSLQHEASDFPSTVTELLASRQNHLRYYQKYAKNFNLDKNIKLKAYVKSVVPKGELWEVTWSQNGGQDETDIFEAVLVCSGRYHIPFVPEISGIETFKGSFLTGNKFKNNRQKEVKGKRVLVLGNSISAADISAVAAETTEQCYLSIGRGCSLVSVCFGHVPFDTLVTCRAGASTSNDISKVKAMMEWNKRQTFPEQEDYGISTNGAEMMNRPFLLTAKDLPSLIRTGRVKVQPSLVRLSEHQAWFSNGQRVEIDTAITATGFDVSFPFLPKDILADTVDELELYRMIWPVSTAKHNMAVIGCVRLMGSFPPFLELQARWAVQVIAGNVDLPDKETMKEEIRTRQANLLKRFGNVSARIDRPVLEYQDFMASQIGCLPTWWHYLHTNPRLALMLRLGPAFPCTYRLVGPHAWPGAPERSIQLFHRWVELLPLKDALAAYVNWITGTVVIGLVAFVLYKKHNELLAYVSRS